MFGDIVRQHRRRLGLSQQELADKSGVTERGLRKIESGRITAPRPVTVRLLADALSLTGLEREVFVTAAHSTSTDYRAATPATPATPPTPAAPAQLPAPVAGFVGRAAALSELDAMLDDKAGQPTAVMISAVSGTAGVGKTTLAVHWAHRVRHRFTDGQLYLNLRGFDPAHAFVTPGEAIRRFLDALSVPPQSIPADPGAQADLYRTLLADKSMLIVLDNVRDPEQVRPLLPGSPGCLVVVTSRNRLAGLIAAEGAHALPLDLLTADESRDLLTRRLGAARVDAEPDAVNELIEECARLPLALAILAANASTRRHRSLAETADQLQRSRDRLDALSTGDTPTTDVRAVFSWSYLALSEDAARMLRRLGLHPGPDITAAAAASLAAEPLDDVRSLLNELADAHLITELPGDRFTVHDLLHAYASDLANTLDDEQQRDAAIGRLLDHYLHTAHTAQGLLSPNRVEPFVPAPPRPGTTPEHPATHEQALAWFTAEHRALLAAVDHAANTGFDTHAWQMAWLLHDFLDRRGHWYDWITIGHTAVAAARRLDNPTAQAHVHRTLARAQNRLGHLDDAHTHLRNALHLFGQAGDLTGQAQTHHTLANVRERQGRYADALFHARRALDLFGQIGDRRGQASALNGIGWHHSLLGEHQHALTYCQQALDLLREIGELPGQAATWHSLGYAHHHLGHHDAAVTCFGHALDLLRDLGDRYNEAVTLTHLGDTHDAAGDLAGARDAWGRALTILLDLGHPDTEQITTKLGSLSRA